MRLNESSDELDIIQTTTLGNAVGDDFGKSALQERISTNLFLGDGSGKPGSDEYGK